MKAHLTDAFVAAWAPSLPTEGKTLVKRIEVEVLHDEHMGDYTVTPAVLRLFKGQKKMKLLRPQDFEADDPLDIIKQRLRSKK